MSMHTAKTHLRASWRQLLETVRRLTSQVRNGLAAGVRRLTVR